jgi:hypothetical protein
MKKIKLITTAVIIISGFTACNSSEKEIARQDAESLTMYVDSVETAPRIYTEANWTSIDDGYRERADKTEKSADKLSSEEKTDLEISKAKFAAMKADYEARLKEKDDAARLAAASDYRMVLRNSLFGEGKIGTDMKFEFVNANNILDVYKRFVNTVEENKNKYTREDWDEVKVLYEALDTRKNVVEKEGLKSADNLKIAGLKVKYATIKSTHRGVSKIAENAEAKQD